MLKKTTHFRAGNRKCRRCKNIFYRQSKSKAQICEECSKKCRRCNVDLDDNRVKVKGKLYYLCLDCKKEIQNLHYTTAKRKDSTKDATLVRLYGITLPEYNKLLEAQEGVCWICKEPPGKRRLAVDHIHIRGDKNTSSLDKRGRIRGLLCWRCNAQVISKHDNPELLRRAADYLEQMPAQRILKLK